MKSTRRHLMFAAHARRWTAAATLGLCAAVATACGSDDAGGAAGGGGGGGQPFGAPRTVQSTLDEAAWQAEVAADANLAQVVSDVPAGSFQAAGVIEDGDGRTVHWAEYATSDVAARPDAFGVVRVCGADGACQWGGARYTAEDASFARLDAGDWADLTLGEPVLFKDLVGKNYQKKETVLVVGALAQSEFLPKPLAEARVAMGGGEVRRCVVFNAYGPQLGVDADAFRSACEATGRFDEITVLHYARRADVESWLPSLSPLDVAVWLGAGVQEGASPSTGKPPKAIGMMLSRGVVGDELYDRQQAQTLLTHAPFGGPGLLVLAGSNTLAWNFRNDNGIFGQYLTRAPHGPVVGFEGNVTVATAGQAFADLMAGLTAGDSLGAAIAAADASGATVHTTLSDEQAAAWRIPDADAGFWETAPSSGQLTLHVKVDPLCVTTNEACSVDALYAALESGDQVPPAQLTASHATFRCDVTFDGPRMACTAKDAATSADFSMQGVMLGTEVGDRWQVYLRGTTDPRYGDMVFAGTASVEAADVAGGTSTLTFGGEATGGTYVNNQGHCCVPKTPLFQDTQGNKSTLVLKP